MRRVARGHRSADNTQNGDDGNDGREPLGGDETYHGRSTFPCCLVRHGMEKIGGGSSPYQGDDTLGNHGAVEDGTALPFIDHAAGHQRRLCGMEAGNGTASNRNEHHREDGVAGTIGVTVLQTAPKFGNGRLVEDECDKKSHRHAEKQNAENGIDLANDFINRQ